MYLRCTQYLRVLFCLLFYSYYSTLGFHKKASDHLEERFCTWRCPRDEKSESVWFDNEALYRELIEFANTVRCIGMIPK